MVFNSYIFILAFMPVMLIGYFLINSKVKNPKWGLGFLLVMSCWFCAWLNIWYLPVTLACTVVNWALGKWILAGKNVNSLRSGKAGRPRLVTGLVLNIGLLLFLKYLNFFTETLNSCFKTNIPLLNLILPLGISFYTFANIAYLVDIYRGDCSGYSLLEFAAYSMYFPKLIQGPIAFHGEIIPKFNDESLRKANPENLSRGLFRFALGLGKKVLLADYFALLVNAGYSQYERIYGLGAVVAFLAYSLQIYFDFSGYCDMAWGVSTMLNINLPENFESPYKAVSISDFWERWHITLTRFFTRYLFIPMGGSRVGTFRTCLNVMIVFLVSGLWHGSNWTFVIWGALHGILMVIERLGRKIKWPSVKSLRTIVTFAIVTVLWSLFRADSLKQFTTMWGRVFRGYFFYEGVNPDMVNALGETVEISILSKFVPTAFRYSHPGIFSVGFVLFGMIICFFLPNTKKLTERFKPTVGRIVITVALLAWCIVSMSGVTQFIYSNF